MVTFRGYLIISLLNLVKLPVVDETFLNEPISILVAGKYGHTMCDSLESALAEAIH